MAELITPRPPLSCAAVEPDESNPLAQCSRCRAWRPISQLDPILLNEDGAKASEGIYCAMCFPMVQVVRSDRWRSLF